MPANLCSFRTTFASLSKSRHQVFATSTASL